MPSVNPPEPFEPPTTKSNARSEVRPAPHSAFEALSRQRLATLVKIGLMGTGLYCIDAMILGHVRRAFANGSCVFLFLFCEFIRRKPGRHNQARILYLAAVSGAFFLTPIFSGAFECKVQLLYGILPLATAYLYGPKAILPSTALTLAGLFFIYEIAPQIPVQQEKFSTPKDHTIMLFVSLCAFGTVAVSMATSARKQFAQLKQASVDLIKSRAQVDAATRSKGVFLANMSHEIRTPMNGILGMLEELQRRDHCSAHAGLIQTAKESGLCLLNKLNNILDFSKMEAGKMALFESPFRPAPLFSEIRQEYTIRAQNKQLALVWNQSEDTPSLLGDRRRLRQLLCVLLDNALSYTDQGTIQVDIEINTDPIAQTCGLSMRVKDEGSGISDRDQARLFSEFEALEPRGDDRNGIGLGLVLANHLAQRMHGTIKVHSELGKGSEFHCCIQLPLVSSTKSTQSAAAHTNQHQKLRVLVVDDEPINRKVARAHLSNFDCTVLEASTGESAVEQTRRKHVDLVLMDLQLADMSGIEATQRILDSDRVGPPPRVVGFSGESDPEVLRAARDSGIEDFLLKPVRAEDLRALLERVRASASEDLAA